MFEIFWVDNQKKLLRDLSEMMEKASSELAYEKAALYRDAIGYLRDILFSQGVEGEGDVDLWFVANDAYRYVLKLMRVRNGKIQAIEHEVFEIDAFMEEQLSSWILGYYQSYPLSTTIAVEIDEGISLSKELLETLVKTFVYIEPAASKYYENIQMWRELALSHLADYLPFLSLEAKDYDKTCQELLDHFSLEEMTYHLECFDISPTSGGGNDG